MKTKNNQKCVERDVYQFQSGFHTGHRSGKAAKTDKRLMDMSCLREAFINTIAHNDWTICEPAVYVFSD